MINGASLPSVKRRRGQSVWTPERRAAAAARARKHQPWKRATGPKTAAGKLRSSLNAWKDGAHCAAAKKLRKALSGHSNFLRRVNAVISRGRRPESPFPIPAKLLSRSPVFLTRQNRS